MINYVDGRVSRVLRWRIRVLSAMSVMALLVAMLMPYSKCWRYVPSFMDGSFGKVVQILVWMTLLACITVGHGVYVALVVRPVRVLVFPLAVAIAMIVSTIYLMFAIRNMFIMWEISPIYPSSTVVNIVDIRSMIQLGGIWAACFCSWLALRQSIVYHKQHC